MKRLIRKADNFSVNSNLYEDNSPEMVKAEIIEEIVEGMNWEGNSEFYPEVKSNDYYSPDEPADISVEAEGSYDLSNLENKYGEITSEDIENIKQELEDNDVINDALQDILDGFKDYHIESYSIDYKVTVSGKKITISANAVDIEVIEY